MPVSEDGADNINGSLEAWRQGDITLDAGLEFFHLANLKQPHSDASVQIADAYIAANEDLPEGPIAVSDTAIVGLAVLSQTCDIIRDCRDRPYVEVAPLIEVTEDELENVRRLKRPALAYVSALADRRLVVHLDRVMTVEKSIVAGWKRTPGWMRDQEARAFAKALARKRARFAFPDDFDQAAKRLQKKIIEKHEKGSPDGAHLRALLEIRVRAAPSWDDCKVHLEWWFIKHGEPEGVEASAWDSVISAWMNLFDTSGRFIVDGFTVCYLQDMTALDYYESDVLELEHLSVSRRKAS